MENRRAVESAKDVLDAERVEYRGHILFAVDEQACQGCGKPIPDGAASDPEWFVDGIVGADGVETADILCSACW